MQALDSSIRISATPKQRPRLSEIPIPALYRQAPGYKRKITDRFQCGPPKGGFFDVLKSHYNPKLGLGSQPPGLEVLKLYRSSSS